MAEPDSTSDAQRRKPNILDSREVPGWPGYLADAEGNIWSSRTRWPFGCVWRLLKLSKRYNRKCYPMRVNRTVVSLCDGTNNSKTFTAGAVILFTFVGPRPEGMECCHEDGDPTNNRLSNLRWDTQQANADDRVRHGRANGYSSPGESHPQAILCEEDIRSIFKLSKTGKSGRAIAKMFKVSPATVCNVLKRKVWKHVTI